MLRFEHRAHPLLLRGVCIGVDEADADRSAATAARSARTRRRTFRSPSSTAVEGSSGVEGVLVAKTSPVAASTATTSVNVPPVSIPMRSPAGASAFGLMARAPNAGSGVRQLRSPARDSSVSARAAAVERVRNPVLLEHLHRV